MPRVVVAASDKCFRNSRRAYDLGALGSTSKCCIIGSIPCLEVCGRGIYGQGGYGRGALIEGVVRKLADVLEVRKHDHGPKEILQVGDFERGAYHRIDGREFFRARLSTEGEQEKLIDQILA